MSELSDYLREHLGDRVADDIVREAEKQGHQIDRSAVYSALKGKHAKRPREDTLAALAAGFGLDVRTLRRLAGKPAGELGPYVPTREAASLTKGQRVALDQLIRTIVSGEGGSSANTDEPRKKSPSPADELARRRAWEAIPDDAAAYDTGEPSEYEKQVEQQDRAAERPDESGEE